MDLSGGRQIQRLRLGLQLKAPPPKTGVGGCNSGAGGRTSSNSGPATGSEERASPKRWGFMWSAFQLLSSLQSEEEERCKGLSVKNLTTQTTGGCRRHHSRGGGMYFARQKIHLSTSTQN